jgi:hypothetical protein
MAQGPWKDILVVNATASVAFVQRVIQDFERKVNEKASTKAKACLTLCALRMQRFRVALVSAHDNAINSLPLPARSWRN